MLIYVWQWRATSVETPWVVIAGAWLWCLISYKSIVICHPIHLQSQHIFTNTDVKHQIYGTNWSTDHGVVGRIETWRRTLDCATARAQWLILPEWQSLSGVRGWYQIGRQNKNIEPTWKILMKDVDLWEPISCLDHVYLGWTQRDCKIRNQIVANFRDMLESRISAGAKEKRSIRASWKPAKPRPNLARYSGAYSRCSCAGYGGAVGEIAEHRRQNPAADSGAYRRRHSSLAGCRGTGGGLQGVSQWQGSTEFCGAHRWNSRYYFPWEGRRGACHSDSTSSTLSKRRCLSRSSPTRSWRSLLWRGERFPCSWLFRRV